MSSQSTPWFRLYSEVLSDRKIQRIVTVTKQPKALIIGVWTTLLSIASDSPERGRLLISEGLPVTLDDISFETGLDTTACQEILKAFTEMNMISVEQGVYEISQWESRQFTSDSSTDRVRKFRDRQKEDVKKGGIENDGYTKRSSNVSVTPPESDTESESDSESLEEKEEKGAPSKIRHSDFARVSLEYQQEIGGLSQTVSDCLDDDLANFPADWVIEAMKRAALSNNRRYSYVRGILTNWKVIGGPQNDLPKSKRNGASKNGSGAPDPAPPRPAGLSPEQMAAARALQAESEAAIAETTQRVNGIMTGEIKTAGIDVERQTRRVSSQIRSNSR
jgi:DnaD/phage-associated family protein